MKYYIYEIIDPRDNNVFYIGKGTHRPGTSRRWVKHIREGETYYPGKRVSNIQKVKIINEIISSGNQPVCRIVFETNTEQHAFIKEKELITKYGRLINNTGCLTNLIEGGSGFHNYTEQMKEVRKIRNSGSNNPMFRRKHSSQSKEKMSISSQKYLKENGPYRHTEGWKQKLRENNPGGKATSKRVYQIDDNGDIIKEWNSTRQAGKILGIKTWRNISVAANKHKGRRVGGYFGDGLEI